MGQLVNFCAGTNMNVLPAKQVGAMLINVPDNGSSKRVIEYTLKMGLSGIPNRLSGENHQLFSDS